MTLQAVRPEAVEGRLRAEVTALLASDDQVSAVVGLVRGMLDASYLVASELAEELGVELIDALDAAGVTWQQDPPVT